MQVKDLSVKSEQLEEIRGGTSSRRYSSGIYLNQQVANGGTYSYSEAFGGVNFSPAYSSIDVKSSPVTNQSASISTLDQKAITTNIDRSVLGFGGWL